MSGKNIELEKLSEKYKNACREETKKSLNGKINDFIDDDSVDKDRKDKIISMIAELLTLK